MWALGPRWDGDDRPEMNGAASEYGCVVFVVVKGFDIGFARQSVVCLRVEVRIKSGREPVPRLHADWLLTSSCYRVPKLPHLPAV